MPYFVYDFFLSNGKSVTKIWSSNLSSKQKNLASNWTKILISHNTRTINLTIRCLNQQLTKTCFFWDVYNRYLSFKWQKGGPHKTKIQRKRFKILKFKLTKTFLWQIKIFKSRELKYISSRVLSAIASLSHTICFTVSSLVFGTCTSYRPSDIIFSLGFYSELPAQLSNGRTEDLQIVCYLREHKCAICCTIFSWRRVPKNFLLIWRLNKLHPGLH